MLQIIRRLLKLSDNYAWKLKIAFVFSFFEGLFATMPIILVLITLNKILENTLVSNDFWLIGGLMILSVVLRAIFKRLEDGFQSTTGYYIFARERMKLGDHLKKIPMGYFSESHIGNISAVITSDVVFVEQYAMQTVSKVIRGYISMIIGIVMMTVLDYRMGIVTFLTFGLAILAMKKMNTVVRHHSFERQNGQSRLVNSVIEYVRGISVIKAFNMQGDKSKKINHHFQEYRDISIDFEEKFVPVYVLFNNCFSLGTAAVVLLSGYLAFSGIMNTAFMLMIIIYIYQFFMPFQVLGTVAAQIRIMEAALDRYDDVMAVKPLIEGHHDKKAKHCNIEFKHVSFAYEDEKVLKDLSFKVKANSMTALVGPSGCGKTTITNLIPRFWDVTEGQILLDGLDIRDYTTETLLSHISMVFQKVYLFEDTVINNLKFGKPDATMDEIIAACKKARCHDFISKLENGYDTLLIEGGASLSGGEKQRISIARAILKDAPIILLDEATASVDPDNEKYIQMAIDELVKNKTLIIIAHKLSTIKHADQIIVLNEGEMIQQGSHESLLEEEGYYKNFWLRRKQARSWKVKKTS